MLRRTLITERAVVMIEPVLVLSQCGGRRLMPVATREGTNFSCPDCRLRWRLARGWTSVVNPETCPKCQCGRVMCSGLQSVSARHHDVALALAVNSPCDSGPDDLGWRGIESEFYSCAREVGIECSPPLS
jgi:hypothetical protein